MKLMKKLVATVCLLGIGSSTVFVGCSGKGEETAVQSKSESKEEAKGSEDTNSDMVGNMYKTGMPIVKDSITLTMVATKKPDQDYFSESPIFKKMEEDTNIKVEWNQIPEQVFSEKKNIMLASGDYPDAFYGNILSATDIMKYGPQGVLTPMNEGIEQYAPNITKLFGSIPDAKRVSTSPDGNIYTLPFVQELEPNTLFTRMFINKIWLDEVGMEVPETTDELIEVLKAFKEADLNKNSKKDEIPMSFRYGSHMRGHYGLFGAFGSMENTSHIYIKDGKIEFQPTTEGYKEGVKYLASLYKEGLIDIEAFTQDDAQYKAKGSSSEAAYGMFFAWNVTDVVEGKNSAEYIPLPPLKGPQGHQEWISRAPAIWRGNFAITDKNKYVNESIRWIDQFYDETKSVEIQYGPVGVNLTETGEGKLEYAPTPDGMDYITFRFKHAPGIGPSAVTAQMFEDTIIPNDRMQLEKEIFEVYKPYINSNWMPPIMYTAEQSSELASLETDIVRHINETQAKWITGASDIEKEWDVYIAQLEKMGLEKLMGIYQEAYDAYVQ